MVKVTNPNLTSADRDKYLAAVKQQGKLTSKNGQEPVQGTSTEARKTETDSNTAPQSSESSEEIICVDDSDSESVKPVTELKVESESKSQVSEETKTCDVQTNVEETQKLGQEHVSECKSVTEDIQMKEQSDEKSDNVEKSPIQKMEEGATSSDLTKPLTIETKFPESSTPSGPSSESTDTASEVGSCFSSPNSGFNSCQNSPQTDNGTGTCTHTKYTALRQTIEQVRVRIQNKPSDRQWNRYVYAYKINSPQTDNGTGTCTHTK